MSARRSGVVLLVALAACVWMGPLAAMVERPSLESLIARSTAVCLVEVVAITGTRAEACWLHEETRVKVLRSLKGNLQRGAEIRVATVRIAPSCGPIEDPPISFPPPPGQAVVFLEGPRQGVWRLTDPREGLWPYDGEAFTDGFSPSLEQLAKTVAQTMNGAPAATR